MKAGPALVLLLLLLSPACKSQEARDKEHKDFGALEELRKKMSKLPKIKREAAEAEAAGSAPLTLGKKGDYLCLFVDPPQDSFQRSAEGYNGKHQVSECERTAASRPGNVDRSKIDQCNDIHYVAAIKTRRLVKPTFSGGSKFVAGLYEYDLLVYDFESGKPLGGAKLTAQNSETVKARPGGFTEDKLLTDLLENACSNVEKAVAAAAK